MRRLALALILVLAPLSGCLSSGDQPSEQGDDSGIYTPKADNDTDRTVRDSQDEDTGEQAEAGPFEQAPRWETGEYWTIQLESTLLDETVEFTRVVAGMGTNGYFVGQPSEDRSLQGLLFHVPGFGQVGFEDFSYAVHGEDFAPVAFPLVDEQSWSTSFEGDPVDAEVTRSGDGTAEITFCCDRNITATYDPDVRAISSLNVDEGFIEYEVTDHGYGFEGEVSVPANRALVFAHGRATGALGFDSEPAAPVENATVPEGYDEVAFLQIAGSTETSPLPTSGAYVERATSPNGTTYETAHAIGETGHTITFHRAANPNGTWQFEHAAGGMGIAFTEGVAYRLFETNLG